MIGAMMSPQVKTKSLSDIQKDIYGRFSDDIGSIDKTPISHEKNLPSPPPSMEDMGVLDDNDLEEKHG